MTAALSVPVFCAAGAFALSNSSPVSLSDVNGKRHILLKPIGVRPTVVLFLGHDCPISNKYSPEINRIAAEYGSRASIYVVYPDPGMAASEAKKHAMDFGYRCPVVLDPRQVLVKRAGATVTPEAAVFDKRGKIAYRGRIDDTYIDFGKRRAAPTRKDLRLALESVLHGKKVIPTTTKAVGCFIPGRT